MDIRFPASLPDVTAVSSAPRPTAAPATLPFADVLAGTVVRGAEGAVNALPGGPLMAVALRGGASAAATRSSSVGSVGSVGGAGVAGLGASGATYSTSGSIGALGGVGANGSSSAGLVASTSSTPEGPSAGSSSGTLGSAMSGALAGATGTGTADGTGVDGSLAQSQQMNMYYLQVQEQVNQENRSFSTLSNVLKAEHDTMKTAIGNIH